MALTLPAMLAAQVPAVPVTTPRVTMSVMTAAASGDAQTGSGFGTALEARWQTAPGFTLVGSVGYMDLGTAERGSTEQTFGDFNAAPTLRTALFGAEAGRPVGTVRPYVRLLGGLSRITTASEIVGFTVPPLEGRPGLSERFRTPSSWGSVTRNTSTVMVGTGTRVAIARRIGIDISINRFESRKVTWAIQPPSPDNDVANPGPPITLRRRTALWVVQLGAAYTLRP